MNHDRTLYWGAAAGALLGVMTFFTLLGPTPLDRSNIGWLFVGDATLYYLAGAFFQDTPWMFPPGLNPRFGLDVPNSIFLTDGVPLVAYVFKIIRGLTGTTGQYMGVWLFLCFALQGLFGWLFVSYFTKSNVLRACTTILLLFMPAFLIRTQELVQYPTSAHFFVLAGFVVYLSGPRHKSMTWIILGLVAILCNSYFFAMVAAIWIADIAQRLWWKQSDWRAVTIEAAGMLGAVGLALWLSGFFITSSGMSTGGFGYWRSNLLSPFDSHGGIMDWSYFFPSMPKVPPEFENGRNFYGAGIIAVLCVALVSWIVCFRNISLSRRLWPLVIASVLMYLFALSNRVAIGQHEFIVPVPAALLRLAGFLRVSDRFVWPLMYLCVGISISVVCQSVNRRIAAVLVAMAAALQVGDTHVAWGGNAGRIAAAQSPVWPSVLVAPFWEKAGSMYKNVRRFPIADREKDWEYFAYFALRHGMATNSVYQSRFDGRAAATANERFVHDLQSGQLDPDTLYVIGDRYAEVAREHHRPEDLLGRIDGFLVLAPNWETCSECKTLSRGE